jgi:hypothetical protein
MPHIPAQALYCACWDGDAAAVSRLLPAGGTRLNLSGHASTFQLPQRQEYAGVCQPYAGCTPLMSSPEQRGNAIPVPSATLRREPPGLRAMRRARETKTKMLLQ